MYNNKLILTINLDIQNFKFIYLNNITHNK